MLVNRDIGLPNGLTFDPFSKLLCWADAGNIVYHYHTKPPREKKKSYFCPSPVAAWGVSCPLPLSRPKGLGLMGLGAHSGSCCYTVRLNSI